MGERFLIERNGKHVAVRGSWLDGSFVYTRGHVVRFAEIYAEDWAEDDLVRDPESFIERLRTRNIGADIFVFSQRFAKKDDWYRYYREMDNLAAIRLSDFDSWWSSRIPHESRKNVRRAQKRGLRVEVAPFSEHLVQGIAEIYHETPVRQGKAFPYYRWTVDEIRTELSSLRSRSDFIVATFEDEIIGYIKLVYMRHAAGILSILAKTNHSDKRPANALIAKAVEVCCDRRIPLLTYGRYVYGKKTDSSLLEFKRRNGFEQIDFPKYFVPLTLKGSIALLLRLHRGFRAIIPAPVLSLGRIVRTWGASARLHARIFGIRTAASVEGEPESSDRAEGLPEAGAGKFAGTRRF
jgi:hypothetical protein